MEHLVLNKNQLEKELNNNIKEKPNKRLISALKESEDIINHKIESKKYNNFDELIKDID